MNQEALVAWIALILSWSANALGIGIEMTRIVQEALYRTARHKATDSGALSSFESDRLHCRHFEAGSDFPSNQFLGEAWPLILHILLTTLFLQMLVADLPGHWVSKRLTQWNTALGYDVSTWFEGACQIFAASIILGTPVGPYGNAETIRWRLISGYIIAGAGLINIVVGMLLHIDEQVQKLRRQVESSGQLYANIASDRKVYYNAMAAFNQLDSSLQGVAWGGDFSAVMAAKNALRKAIKAGM